MSRSIIGFFLSLLLIFAASESFSQKKITIGFQLGPNMGFPRYTDLAHGNLSEIGGSFGANIIFFERNNFLLETGFYKYQIGYSAEVETYSFGSQIRGKLIPLRLQKRLNLFRSKIFLTPSLGFSYLKAISKPDYHYNYPTIYYSVRKEDTLHYVSISHKGLRNNMFFQETGLKIEFLIIKRFILDLACFYSLGFAKASEGEMSYRINNGDVMTKKVVSRGNNIQYFIGLRYIVFGLRKEEIK